MIKSGLRLPIIAGLLLATLAFLSFSPGKLHQNDPGESPAAQEIWVFYKEQPPSMETQAIVSEFLEDYKDQYTIEYRLITDPEEKQALESLGLSPDHLPIAIAINGKTSAMIDGEKIVFVNFPDIMHHIGRHKGNWTLNDLGKVLDDNALLLDENPVIKNQPGGSR